MLALLPMAARAPVKPPCGAPCNGCGCCCAEEPCGLAVVLLRVEEGPCPALEWNGEQFRCGLVRQPSRYIKTPPEMDARLGEGFAESLGAGRGCDSEIDGVDFPED